MAAQYEKLILDLAEAVGDLNKRVKELEQPKIEQDTFNYDPSGFQKVLDARTHA